MISERKPFTRLKSIDNIPQIISNTKLRQSIGRPTYTYPITKVEQPIYYSNQIIIEDMTYENTNYYLTANGFTSNEIELQSSLHTKLFSYINCSFKIYPKTYNANKAKIQEYIKSSSNSSSVSSIEKLNFKYTNELYNNIDILENKFNEPVHYNDTIMLMHEASHKFLKCTSSHLYLTSNDDDCTLFRIEPHQTVMLNDDYILKTGQAVRIVPYPVNYASGSMGVVGLQFGYDRYRLNDNDRFNKKTYKYSTIPSVKVGKFFDMKWRLSLYECNTHDERVIKYGDWIRIEHCGIEKCISMIGSREDTEGMFGLTKEQEKEMEDKFNIYSINEEIEREENRQYNYIQHIANARKSSVVPLPPPLFSQNDIKYHIQLSHLDSIDLNSIFIIENAIPLSRKKCPLSHFVTCYSNDDIFGISNHKSVFRLKHFLTNKFLTRNKSNTKFTLIRDPGIINDNYLVSDAYKNSLFGTKSCIISTGNKDIPMKDDFLRLFHINSKKYIIIENKTLQLNDNELDKEIFRFGSFDEEFIVEMRFISKLFLVIRYLMGSKKTLEEKGEFLFYAGGHILNKINKYIQNKTNHFHHDKVKIGDIVTERQDYLLQFNFGLLVFDTFLKKFWLKDNYKNLRYLVSILNDINMEYTYNEYHMKKKENNYFQLFKFSERTFEFCLYFVKHNKTNKNYIFENYMHILIFFISISKYALLTTIEIFKDNSNAIQKIYSIEDNCAISTAIADIYKYFFNIKIKEVSSNLFIKLIIDYIKISHNKHNNYTKYVIDNKDQIALSLNKKEDYFTLLMTLCKSKLINFIQMQNVLIKEITVRDNNDNFFIDNFVKTIDEVDIKTFIISLMEKNENDVINEAIRNEDLFNISRIIDSDIEQNKNFLYQNFYNRFKINMQIFNYQYKNKTLYFNPNSNNSIQSVSTNISNMLLDPGSASAFVNGSIPLIGKKIYEFYYKKIIKKNDLFDFSKDNPTREIFANKVDFLCEFIGFVNHCIRDKKIIDYKRIKKILNYLSSFFMNEYMMNNNYNMFLVNEMERKKFFFKNKISMSPNNNYNKITKGWLDIYSFLIQKFTLHSVVSIKEGNPKTKKSVNLTEENFKIRIGDNNRKSAIIFKNDSVDDFTTELLISDIGKYRERVHYNEGSEMILENGKSVHEKRQNCMLNEKMIYYETDDLIKEKDHSKNDASGNLIKKNFNNNLLLKYFSDDKNKIPYESVILQNKKNLLKNLIDMYDNVINENLNYLKYNFRMFLKNNFKNKQEDLFNQFISTCIPNLQSEIPFIDELINLFYEKKFSTFKKKNDSSFTYMNINKICYSQILKRNLNLIQKMILFFNSCDDTTIQHRILKFFNRFFSVREKLFRYINNCNYQNILNNIDSTNPFNDIAKIKKDIDKYFVYYNCNNCNLHQSEFTQKNLNIIRKLLNFIKYELRKDSIEHYAIYYTNKEIHEKNIYQIENFISSIENFESNSDIDIQLLNKFIYDIFFFIRDNININPNNYFFFFYNILHERTTKIKKRYTTLINDFTLRNLSTEQSVDNFTYCNFSLIIIIGKILNITELGNIVFILYKDNISYSPLCFIPLLSITDDIKNFISLNFNFILEQMMKCISQKDDWDIFVLVEIYQCILYLITEILKYIKNKDMIVSEGNTEENLIELITFYISSYNKEKVIENDSYLTAYLKLMKYITKISLLFDLLRIALTKQMKYFDLFLKPHELYPLFERSINDKINHVGSSNRMLIYLYEYFWFYQIFVDDSYFTFAEGNKTILSIRNFIEFVCSGKNITDIEYIERLAYSHTHMLLIYISKYYLSHYDDKEFILNQFNIASYDIENSLLKCIDLTHFDQSIIYDEYVLRRIAKYQESTFQSLQNNNDNKTFDDLFREILVEHKSEIRNLVLNEKKSFSCYLVYLLILENEGKFDNSLMIFINKIVKYISNYNIYSKDQKVILFIYQQLTSLLEFFDDNESKLNKYPSMKKKTLNEIQKLIEKSDIISKSLKIISLSEQNKTNNRFHSKILIYEIFTLFSLLLKKGNFYIQESFYTLLSNPNTNYEFFISFIYNRFRSRITQIENGINSTKLNLYYKIPLKNKLSIHADLDSNLERKILEFVQLLCENHNRKLQKFMNNQKSFTHFKSNYNLIKIIIQYLITLCTYYEKENYLTVKSSFDTIIEFIQGPCIENQITIIKSKLLFTLKDIFNIYIGKYLSESANKIASKISFNQLGLIVEKATILLLAVIEGRTKDDPIYEEIRKCIGVDTIENTINYIYYNRKIAKNGSRIEELELYELDREDEENDKEEVSIKEMKELNNRIEYEKSSKIECGFNLFYVLNYLKDYKSNQKGITLKKKSKKKKCVKLLKDTLFYSLYKFIYEILFTVFNLLLLFFLCLLFLFSFGKFNKFLINQDIKNLLKNVRNENRLKGKDSKLDQKAKKFFKKYTKSIEILREGVVYKIYFLKYPFCFINKFDRDRFLENLDRKNQKRKLMNIMRYANELKFELEYSYKVRTFFDKIPIIGIIFHSVELWKDLSLILNLMQNFLNIAAVYKKGTITYHCNNGVCEDEIEYTDEKTIFGLDKETLSLIVLTFSYIQCILSSILFFQYICRKTPRNYLIAQEKLLAKSKRMNIILLKIIFIQKFLAQYFFDFDFYYYLLYTCFAFLGWFGNDFFFSLLLLEIVQRIKTLRNVIMAIINPIKQLSLTFLLWLILIYYAALIAYIFYKEDFPNEHDCMNLLNCVSAIFYYNNKMDNGLGGYLKETTYKDGGRFIGRYFYGELINLLIKILIIQIVSGIIIDNFALLRVGEVNMLYDMKHICTICGKNKEDINKVYSKYGKKFENHISEDHMIFNYIYYIIYIYKKNHTDYNGIESYVYDLVFTQKDITWFPDDVMYLK